MRPGYTSEPTLLFFRGPNYLLAYCGSRFIPGAAHVSGPGGGGYPAGGGFSYNGPVRP